MTLVQQTDARMKIPVIFVGANPAVLEHLCQRPDLAVAAVYYPPACSESATLFTICQVYGVRAVGAGCSSDIEADLKNIGPVRLGICCYYEILKPAVFQYPELGFINIHPSALPAHKGRTPWFHMLANNERVGGVTLHQISDRPDGGDILARREFPIGHGDTYAELAAKTDRAACGLLDECLADFLVGRCSLIANTPGGAEKGVRTAQTFSFRDPPLKIYNLIRTQAGYRGCAVRHADLTVHIRSALLDRLEIQPPQIGTVVRVAEDAFWIGLRDGLSLKVRSWSPAAFMPVEGARFEDIGG